MAMSPEKREQVLEKLPPQQQANLRERLDRFDKLPAGERARLNQMWNTFNSLPPEKQAVVTRQMQAFNNLPDDRREELKPVLQRLRLMPEDRRNTLLGSEAFKNRFSPSELQMLPISRKTTRFRADKRRARWNAHFCTRSLTRIPEFFRNLLYYPENFDTVLKPIRCPYLKQLRESPAARSSDEEDREK